MANDTVQALLEANRDNVTALSTIRAPQWAPAPEYRGTSSILWSCMLTIVACVYTALHLNIPAKNLRGSEWRLGAHKALWALAALLVPELVLYIAASQFFNAWWLQRKLNELLLSIPAEERVLSVPVSLKYCFFVVMGGMQVPIDDLCDKHDEQDHGQLMTLSYKGVWQLAKLGHFLPASDAMIDDRSKASVLQKCLVLLQVSWMALNCVIRRAYGLPLTLLEIHTMVHVVCAAVMYAFLFEKPLDILEPEVLDSSSWQNALALMVQLSSETECYPLTVYPRQSASQEPVIAKELNSKGVLVDSIDNQTGEPIYVRWMQLPDRIGQRWRAGDVLPCGLGPQSGDHVLTGRTVVRLERISNLLDALERGGNETGVREIKPLKSWFSKEGNYYHDAFSRSGNLPPELAFYKDPKFVEKTILDFKLANNSELPMLMIYLFTQAFDLRSVGKRVLVKLADNFSAGIRHLFTFYLPAIYGGVHLFAWNAEFPSAPEALLWKISCISIMAMPSWLFLLILSALRYNLFRMQRVSSSEGGRNNGVLHSIRTFVRILYICVICVISVIGVAFALLYILARLYIIVESFISLRAVPVGVYLTPSWIQMIPHV
ncbi:hypothetical protein QBC46DRAFT_377836 [Diplogelasinospora grovesii]|uniref:Uncharacterized protein n=1 Tax=Diplogelasinospora grovesii TaxID=303347 RepID=A0AAN6S7F1_9PEZI|nr:hypothetical protein QBC46DRAFT_377836 [Diplogelasinospora grovesii]